MLPRWKNLLLLGRCLQRQRRTGYTRPGNPLGVEELEHRTLYATGVTAALVAPPRGVPMNDGQPVAVILRGAPLAIAPLSGTTPTATVPTGPTAASPGPAPASRPDSTAGQPMFPQPGDLNGDRGIALALIPRAMMEPVPGNLTDRSARSDFSSIGSLADPSAAERTADRKLDLAILG